MDAFRFIHAADLHLDSPLLARGESVRRRLLEATREAFRRLVALALEEKVDALLLAGDVFDDARLSFATEALIVSEITRLSAAGITTVLATGNHDPGGAGLRAHAIPWPAERFVLAASAEPVRIAIPGRDGLPKAHIVAIGHEEGRESRDLVQRLPAPPPGVPAVALLHALVRGARALERHAAYAPTTVQSLAAKPYDYFALGHVHRRQRVLERPAAHYPGNLQGRDFGECGEKGALQVEIRERGAPPAVAFRALAPVRFEEIIVSDLVASADFESIARRVEEPFDALRAGASPGTEWMLRVRLEGACPLAASIRRDPEDLADALAARFGLLEAEVDAARLVHAADRSRFAGSPVPAALRALIEEAQADEALLARLGERSVATLPAGAEGRTAWLRTLLDGAEAGILDRLLEDGAR